MLHFGVLRGDPLTCGGFASSHGPGDGVVRDDVLFDFAEALGTGSNQSETLSTVDIEHVRRGVELPQVSARRRLVNSNLVFYYSLAMARTGRR